MSGSVRRILVLARATLCDLGHGMGGGIAFVVLLGFLLLPGPVAGSSSEESLRLALEQRVGTFALLTALTTLLAGAWSVAEDRRSRRLVQWLATPLHAWEYVAGKIVGCSLGCGLLAVILQGVWLGLGGLDSQNEASLFQPRAWQPATASFRVREGEYAQAPRGDVALLAGDVGEFRFDVLPEHAGSVDLHVALRKVAYSGSAPTLPRLSAATDRRAIVKSQPLIPSHGLLEDPITIPLPLEDGRQLLVRIVAGTGFEGALVIDREALVLRGPPGSLPVAVLRSLLGVFALVSLCTAGAVALATALPDILAFVAAAFGLLVGLAQGFLLEVAASVAQFHESMPHWAVRLSAGLARVLDQVPDLNALIGADLLARARAPGGAADGASWGVCVVLLVALWLAGGAFLKGAQRWTD